MSYSAHMLYTTPFFSIYFGNAQDRLMPADYLVLAGTKTLAAQVPFANVCRNLRINNLTFLHQTHSTDGCIVSNNHDGFPLPFAHQGDFLMTQSPVGVGIMAADCLPIIMYDTRTHSIGIVHAGWRGSVARIGTKVLAYMQQQWDTQSADIHVVFGPAARSCCYQVTPEFCSHLAPFHWADKTIEQRQGTLFFDLAHFNYCLLSEAGIPAAQFTTDYQLCTMCDHQFYSHRRQGDRAGRQMTVAALHG